MKLRKRGTREIVEIESITSTTSTLKADKNTIQLTGTDTNGHRIMCRYKSLAELNEEWEDCEEPKEYWAIFASGEIERIVCDNDDFDNNCKQNGNYFKTKEEAEKAVEKLKAWKRLKDKGFRFDDYGFLRDNGVPRHIEIKASIEDASDPKLGYADDLMMLFGGEE